MTQIKNPLFAKSMVYPVWYDEKGLEEAFPSVLYIREKGEGADKQSAENDAVYYISLFFETEAAGSYVSELKAIQSIDTSEVIETTDIRKEISSNTKLFGIEFTEPFYHKKEKKWYSVAYINRKEAWNRYEIEVSAERDRFLSYYESAISEKESFNRIKLLKESLRSGDVFTKKYTFANILSKNLTQESFGKDIKLLASIPSLIKKEQLSNPLYINVNNDDAGVIETAVRNSFTNLGFVINNSKENAAYIIKADINLNKSTGTNMIVLNPYITLSVLGKNGFLYVYSAKTEKVVAPTENTAKKIAAKDIAENLNETLENDLKNEFGL